MRALGEAELALLDSEWAFSHEGGSMLVSFCSDAHNHVKNAGRPPPSTIQLKHCTLTGAQLHNYTAQLTCLTT